MKAMLLVSIQDQPERRSACGITAGSGRYTRRWGYAFPVDEHKDKLPSCDQCFMEELMDKINGAFDEAGAANEERDNNEKKRAPGVTIGALVMKKNQIRIQRIEPFNQENCYTNRSQPAWG